MNSVGSYLRSLRTNLNLSLNDVYEKTGITTSRLNRIEHGEILEPSPIALKKLSSIYHFDLIKIYIMLGYLDKDTFIQSKVFNHYEYLDEEERNFIQHSIDFLVYKNHKNNEVNNYEI